MLRKSFAAACVLLFLLFFLPWLGGAEEDTALLPPSTDSGGGEVQPSTVHDSARLLRVLIEGEVVEMDMETYLQGVIRAEMPATFALEALKAEGAAVCFLEVRSRNTPALALYDALGFSRAGLRRRFFTNPPDDAIVMNRLL